LFDNEIIFAGFKFSWLALRPGWTRSLAVLALRPGRLGLGGDRWTNGHIYGHTDIQ